MKMTNRTIIQVDDREIPAGTLMLVEYDQPEQMLVSYRTGGASYSHWLPKALLTPLPPEPQLPAPFLYNFSEQERARLLTDAYMIRYTVSCEAWEDLFLSAFGDGDPVTGWHIDSPPYTIGISRPARLAEIQSCYFGVTLTVRYPSTLNES